MEFAKEEHTLNYADNSLIPRPPGNEATLTTAGGKPITQPDTAIEHLDRPTGDT